MLLPYGAKITNTRIHSSKGLLSHSLSSAEETGMPKHTSSVSSRMKRKDRDEE